MQNVIASKIMIAAAPFTRKACCGRDIQLNICMGSTVNSSIGELATKGTYASAPITINGAVSPMARDNARITPVRIPPDAAGNTWYHIVCQRVAPMP